MVCIFLPNLPRRSKSGRWNDKFRFSLCVSEWWAMIIPCWNTPAEFLTQPWHDKKTRIHSKGKESEQLLQSVVPNLMCFDLNNNPDALYHVMVEMKRILHLDLLSERAVKKKLLEMTQTGHFTAFVSHIRVKGTGKLKVRAAGSAWTKQMWKEWMNGIQDGEGDDGWDQCSVLSAALTNGCYKVVKYLRPAMLLKSPMHQKVTWENKQGIWL